LTEFKKELSKELEKLMNDTGAGTLSRVHKFRVEMPVLSTGITALDLAVGAVDPVTGIPGITLGDIVEICGENNSYKTGTWEHMARETLRTYGPYSVVGVFSEPPDTQRMIDLGIDPDHIISIDCFHEEAEQKNILAKAALEALLKFAKMPDIKLCIIDSIGNLTAETEIYDAKGKERGIGDRTVAAQAVVFNDFISRYSKLEGIRPTLLMVNFYREAINTGFGFSQPTPIIRHKSPAGRGKEFACNVRILCSSTPKYSETKHSVLGNAIELGREVTYKIFKNKNSHTVGTRTVKTSFNFKTKKINNSEILLNYATFFQFKEGAETKSLLDPPLIQAGAWYRIGSERFQGSTKAIEYLDNNPDLCKSLLVQIAKNQDYFFEDDKNFKSEYILDQD